MPAPEGLETFTAATWDRDVLRSKLPVVVGFWAEWCVPCHMAGPAMAEAARAEAGRMRFGVVDFDEDIALAERYEVRGLPTVLVIRDGAVVQRRVGLMGRKELRRLVDGG